MLPFFFILSNFLLYIIIKRSFIPFVLVSCCSIATILVGFCVFGHCLSPILKCNFSIPYILLIGVHQFEVFFYFYKNQFYPLLSCLAFNNAGLSVFLAINVEIFFLQSMLFKLFLGCG